MDINISLALLPRVSHLIFFYFFLNLHFEITLSFVVSDIRSHKGHMKTHILNIFFFQITHSFPIPTKLSHHPFLGNCIHHQKSCYSELDILVFNSVIFTDRRGEHGAFGPVELGNLGLKGELLGQVSMPERCVVFKPFRWRTSLPVEALNVALSFHRRRE